MPGSILRREGPRLTQHRQPGYATLAPYDHSRTALRSVAIPAPCRSPAVDSRAHGRTRMQPCVDRQDRYPRSPAGETSGGGAGGISGGGGGGANGAAGAAWTGAACTAVGAPPVPSATPAPAPAPRTPINAPPPPPPPPRPLVTAIAFELIDVDNRNVTAGGVMTAKLPHFLRNARRSSSGCGSFSGFTGTLPQET